MQSIVYCPCTSNDSSRSSVIIQTLDSVISAVSLVSPKPGIFVSSVEHLLAISTTTHFVLFALVDRDDDHLHLEESR